MNENGMPVCKRLRSRAFYLAEPEEAEHFNSRPKAPAGAPRP